MRGRKKIGLKSIYIFCFILILAIGLMGVSYAYWTDAIYIINNISMGKLDTELFDVEPDSILIEEALIFENNGNGNNGNGNGNNKIPKGHEKRIGKGHLCNNKGKGHIKNGCFISIEGDVEINFEIINSSTLPIKLMEDINLNNQLTYRINYYYDKNKNNEITNLDHIISNRIYGKLSISKQSLFDFMENKDSYELIVILNFSQSNLLFGGWFDEEYIRIQITKETIIEAEIVNDKVLVEDNNIEVINSVENSLEGGMEDEED